jgi:hypothetical protein
VSILQGPDTELHLGMSGQQEPCCSWTCLYIPQGPELPYTTEACAAPIDLCILQRPELLLYLSGQQKPVLLLELSILQRPELHLDMSGQQVPVLLLEVSALQTPVLHLDLCTLQRPQLHLDLSGHTPGT